MKLNNIMIAVLGVSILAAPAHSANMPSMGFIQRMGKSCTDNCKVDACSVPKDRKWCEDKCNHKIDMNVVCAKAVPMSNKPMSDQEKALANQVNNMQGNQMGKMPMTMAPAAPKDAPMRAQ